MRRPLVGTSYLSYLNREVNFYQTLSLWYFSVRGARRTMSGGMPAITLMESDFYTPFMFRQAQDQWLRLDHVRL